MVFGSLYLGTCWASAFLFLTRARPIYWVFALVVLSTGLLAQDSLLLSYPLLLALAVYRTTLPTDNANTLPLSRKAATALAFLFAPLGLLPLIKESFFVICVGMAALYFFILWHRRRRALAYSAVLLPLIAAELFWLLSGQPLTGLPYFVLSALPITSGYAEAMGTPGHTREILVFLVAAVALVCGAASGKGLPAASRLFLVSVVAIFLFVAFKTGFVRHDSHAVIAGTCLVSTAMLLVVTIQHKHLNAIVLLSVFAWAYIDREYYPTSTRGAFSTVHTIYAGAVEGLRMRASSHGELLNLFSDRVAAIGRDSGIPPMSGTTDIYSCGQASLLASGNRWSPRPIPQSYAAYTPRLARLNEAHLTGDDAPDNIIFKMEPIEDRLPSLEDGLSWPTLLQNYVPRKLDKGLLYLSRAVDRNAGAKRVEIYRGSHDLGEDIAIPPSAGLVFAELDLRQTLGGQMVSFLYKPQRLEISVELSSGLRKSYRMISGMARTGFVVSPLVEYTDEFALLSCDVNCLPDKRVKSIRVSPVGDVWRWWHPKYTVTLSRIEWRGSGDVGKVIKFDAMEGFENRAAPSAGMCDGVIDFVNGSRLGASRIRVSRVLSVRGWLAVSVKDGVAADAVFVTLTREQGNGTYYIRARSTPRLDVNQQFGQPDMADVGFEVTADVSGMEGNFVLGLARTYKGRRESCQQCRLPILIQR
ncbi:MAG: hypothetical protein ACYC35_02935 [Pirellulales bacterium]